MVAGAAGRLLDSGRLAIAVQFRSNSAPMLPPIPRSRRMLRKAQCLMGDGRVHGLPQWQGSSGGIHRRIMVHTSIRLYGMLEQGDNCFRMSGGRRGPRMGS